MMYNRKTTAEDLAIIGLTVGGGSLIFILVGMIYYPIVWIGLFLFTCSLALIVIAILVRNRL